MSVFFGLLPPNDWRFTNRLPIAIRVIVNAIIGMGKTCSAAYREEVKRRWPCQRTIGDFSGESKTTSSTLASSSVVKWIIPFSFVCCFGCCPYANFGKFDAITELQTSIFWFRPLIRRSIRRPAQMQQKSEDLLPFSSGNTALPRPSSWNW